VPIRWGVYLKNSGLGEAEIVIRKHKTFAGCKRYIRRLQKRFTPLPEIEAKLTDSHDESDSASERFPIVFVSLLRKGLPDRNRTETNLAAAFDKALSMMRKMHQLNVAYYALDWHEMDKQLGTQGLIEALWHTMRGLLESHGIASGYFSKQPSKDGGPTTDWHGKHTMCWSSQQQGLARYNCADSLDRTNIASFFICVQVFVEQCRRLELAVLTGDDDTVTEVPRLKPTFRERLFGGLLSGSASPTVGSVTQPAWPTTGRGQQRKVYRPDLPHGWEAKIDSATGCTYYIDHINRKTSWTLPDDKTQTVEGESPSSFERKKSFRTRCKEEILATEAWAMLNSTVDEVRRKVLPEALSSIADVFLQNGDRNSFFYTGSQAMHSDKIMIFEPETSQLKKNSVGGASNSFIAITRRYNNILKDSDRQAQIELFLGINLEKHFLPSHSVGKQLDSLNIVYKPRILPQDTEDTDDEDDPVNHINYPSLGTTTTTPSEEPIEAVRSMSSPNLRQYVSEGDATDVREELSEAREEDDQIQMYSFEEEIRSMKTSQTADASSSSADLVPGLREISTSSDPLL